MPPLLSSVPAVRHTATVVHRITVTVEPWGITYLRPYSYPLPRRLFCRTTADFNAFCAKVIPVGPSYLRRLAGRSYLHHLYDASVNLSKASGRDAMANLNKSSGRQPVGQQPIAITAEMRLDLQ